MWAGGQQKGTVAVRWSGWGQERGLWGKSPGRQDRRHREAEEVWEVPGGAQGVKEQARLQRELPDSSIFFLIIFFNISFFKKFIYF